jgi:UDP-N-acetylglucosamine 2-epimerase (non-hydrolysing)
MTDVRKLIVVVGARPNFIKIGPLMPAFERAGIEALIAHTGQHYDTMMSDVFFSDLQIPKPHWFLGVGSGTHAAQTGKAMIALEELLIAEKPDALLVVGDVNSTLAGALAAAKIGVPVIHLEAGLRSGDMSMPEEINRLVTDQLSSMLLTPVVSAEQNLRAESIDASRIHFVGNVMAQSVLMHAEKARRRVVSGTESLMDGGFVLATIHRPENTDHPERLAEIATAISSLDMPVLLPAHPRTRPLLAAAGIDESRTAVRIIDPVGYLDMLALQMRAALVITDSGGIQEETCMLHTPCVTVRRNTERQITLELGSNRLVSADHVQITGAVHDGLAAPMDWDVPERWDESVSDRVIAALAAGIQPLTS